MWAWHVTIANSSLWWLDRIVGIAQNISYALTHFYNSQLFRVHKTMRVYKAFSYFQDREPVDITNHVISQFSPILWLSRRIKGVGYKVG